MIGIFDSGAGGLVALKKLRSIKKDADICFYADRDNSPYGTKTKDELIPLVKRDIDILNNFGADRVLMACCTASTVWEDLPKRYREISLPIIMPTAAAAVTATKNGKIGVIATERTVLSHAFKDALLKINSRLSVTEIATQSFVEMAETGTVIEKTIKDSLLPLRKQEIDTLVLGCTHFSLLFDIVASIMGGVSIIDSAEVGAKTLAREYGKKEAGLTYFL